MKYVFLALCCSLVLSSVLYCQEDSTKPADRVAYFYGGVSYPYLPGEFKDFWKTGWNGGLGYGYSFAPGSLGYAEVFATVDYSRSVANIATYRKYLLEQYPDPKLKIAQGVITSRGTNQAITAMLNLKGSFSSTKHTIAPYFLAGIGYFHLSADSLSLATNDTTFYSVQSESRSAFTWSFGLGIEVPVSESTTFFIQARSILGVLDPTRQYFPVSGGFRMTL